MEGEGGISVQTATDGGTPAKVEIIGIDLTVTNMTKLLTTLAIAAIPAAIIIGILGGFLFIVVTAILKALVPA